MKNSFLLTYFGHHKAASTWAVSIIKQVCQDIGLKHIRVESEKIFDFDLKKFVEREKPDFLSYTNAELNHVKNLENFRGFHIIRDPRDIVVSAYFSHLHSHPTDKWTKLIEHRNKLENSSKDEGLFLEMEFRRNQFDAMYNWDYSLPNVYDVKMEELVINPYKSFVDIFEFLGIVDESEFGLKARSSQLATMTINRLSQKSKVVIPFRFGENKIPVESLLGIIYKHEFSKLAGGRNLGEENVKSHYRKGVSGDWRNHFKEEHIKLFKEKYSDLLIKLGYESDSDW